MVRKIEKFALGWHPKRGCAYRIQAGAAWSHWTPVSPSDLAALAAIFSKEPVYLHPDGTINTDAESVG